MDKNAGTQNQKSPPGAPGIQTSHNKGTPISKPAKFRIKIGQETFLKNVFIFATEAFLLVGSCKNFKKAVVYKASYRKKY